MAAYLPRNLRNIQIYSRYAKWETIFVIFSAWKIKANIVGVHGRSHINGWLLHYASGGSQNFLSVAFFQLKIYMTLRPHDNCFYVPFFNVSAWHSHSKSSVFLMKSLIYQSYACLACNIFTVVINCYLVIALCSPLFKNESEWPKIWLLFPE